MPSLRVLSVVLLAGLGATAAGLAGGSQPDPEPRTAAVQRAATTSDASPPPRGTSRAARSSSSAFDVSAENSLPGIRNWRISRTRGEAVGLGAYADAVSVRAGERVALHATGTGTVQVRALRIGWYGGAGARVVWSGSFPATSTSQEDPASWPALGFVETRDWPVGQYLLRLDLGGASRYVPLTIRSPSAKGQVLLVTSPLTWQAQNGATPAGEQARSYDRPYAAGYGAGGFLPGDMSIIQLAERDGGRLAYTSDVDLALAPASVDVATAVVFGSGSTYWPADLRTAMIGAIHKGVNAAFFGAGTGTRRVDLSSDGRSMTVARAVPPPTPVLTGLRPVCSPRAADTASAWSGDAAWIVQDPAWWGYADAGVSAGQSLAGLVSTAPDGLPEQAPSRPVTVLSQSPVSCSGAAALGPQAALYSTDPSGAGVFTAGTGRWACAAAGACPSRAGGAVPASTRAVAVQVTRTVLVAFAAPKAGRDHPAR